MTLYAMKEALAEISAQMRVEADFIAKNAANPETKLEDLDVHIEKRDELKKRFDALKAEHDDAEARSRETVEKKAVMGADPTKEKQEAKGKFYKAAFMGGDTARAIKDYQGLGAIPANDADLGYGDKLLPTTMENELIIEPPVENPMRAIVRVSQITGLEEPKILYDLSGGFDDITDKDVAKEIKQTGDMLTYDRHKVKPLAKISDTVMHGSPFNLAAEVESALKSGLAENEMKRMFDTAPATAFEKMSFYSDVNAVKVVTNTTKQSAVASALADLPLAFRRNAKIVMSGLDWFNMWAPNLNQSGMFFEDRPLSLYGKPVVLCDDAVDPVVGDFSYCRINYDIGTIYDTDKDVDSGYYKFVLTAWYDIRLRLASAFRIAKVGAAPAG